MVKVKVVMEPGWELKIQAMPKLQKALTDHAWAIAGRANANSAGFRTRRAYNKGVRVGEKQPLYAAKDAIFTGKRSVALVYTANYAAALDNSKHNTLLKSE